MEPEQIIGLVFTALGGVVFAAGIVGFFRREHHSRTSPRLSGVIANLSSEDVSAGEGGTVTRYYAHIRVDNQQARVQVRKSVWRKLITGDTLEVVRHPTHPTSFLHPGFGWVRSLPLLVVGASFVAVGLAILVSTPSQ